MNEYAGSSSSSSPFNYGWNYHVFLSFRGEDTRRGFAGNLYRDLCERGIRTFRDDQGIRKGEQITQTLLNVIKESQTAIIIFSANYASSTFCLKELVQILDCVKGKGRFIWPVFYHVDPSHVRHQKESYKVAFDRYEGVKDDELVKSWRSALTRAADLAGWSVDPNTESYEYEIREKIIEVVSKEINVAPSTVASFPVGLEGRVKEVCSLLNEQPDCDGAQMVGIYGLPGVGKTTLARAVYNEMTSKFRHLCFLDNVREKSIHDLPKTLLSKTIREKDNGLEHEKSEIPIIKDRLCNIKVLLVLDDIDSLEQLKALAGSPNWFGAGSIIIITTKDRSLAKKHAGSKIYEVQGLNKDEARELLIWNAFRSKEEVDPEYEDVVNHAIDYAGGLPLVLETLGSKLCDLTVDEWESTLAIYKENPEKNVHKILKVSYDSLEEEHQKVFLDIACFYKGCKSKYATNMLWSSYGFRPESCIRALIDKSLVKIDEGGFLKMHDLIQDMGQEIVRQESPLNPGKRSRLWDSKGILDVLEECKGTDKLQAIKLDCPDVREVRWSGDAFDTMKSLKVLIVNNAKFSGAPKSLPSSLRVLDWIDYPSTTLPPNFNPRNLVILNLPCSLFRQALESFQWGNLRYLNLEHNENLVEVPNMSQALNLEELCVAHCKNLTKIGSSFGTLPKLKVLVAQSCTRLKSFLEDGIKLTSLEILNLTGCSNFQNFPEILEKMNNIKTIALSGTAIEKLPKSIEKLASLECLYLHNCRRLRQIPVDSFCKLTKLVRLEAGSCGIFNQFKDQEVKWPVNLAFSHVTRLHLNQNNISDELLVMVLRWFPVLQVLELRDNNITVLPACIKECTGLKRLYLDGCKQLREIRVISPNIKVLSAVNCISLTSSSLGLISQALHEAGNTKFILPGEWIPECFHCCNFGSSVAFSVHKRFPEIAVCVVFDVKGRGSCHFEFEIQVLINGTYNFVVKTDVLDIETSHIYVFDDLWHQSLFEFRRELPKGKFNHVRISCSVYHTDALSDAYVRVKCIGVYVYNFESCMDDVLFENPNPPKRVLEDWICDADMKSWVYSDSSREDSLYYKYCQTFEAYEKSGSDVNSYDINSDGNDFLEDSSDLVNENRMLQLQPEFFCPEMQQQQHLTGIQEKTIGSSGNCGKGQDKDVLVYRGDANKERDHNNSLFKDPMECGKDQAVSNDQSTEKYKGYEGRTGSVQQIDRWYSCLCVIVSLVVLCRYVLLLLQLLRGVLSFL